MNAMLLDRPTAEATNHREFVQAATERLLVRYAGLMERLADS